MIGKDVRLGLLQAIADQSEEKISRGLIRLQAAEFLYETSLFPEVEYTFKHALTHEVAYGSVLQDRRRVLHGRIVESIERLYPDRLSEHIELLAHHASRGELWQKAVEYLHQAGKKAASRSATQEAIAYFEQALDFIKNLPEDKRTIEKAINIRVDLGPALIATSGFPAARVEDNYSRARVLCERLGETLQLFPVLWGLARMHDTRSELKEGRVLAERLLDLAQRAQEPALLLEAHHELWANLSGLGELTTARLHMDEGFTLYDPKKHRHHALLYGGHDPGVCCAYHAAEVLWQTRLSRASPTEKPRIIDNGSRAISRIHDVFRLVFRRLVPSMPWRSAGRQGTCGREHGARDRARFFSSSSTGGFFERMASRRTG